MAISHTISVSLGDRSYPIDIGHDLLENAELFSPAFPSGTTILTVADVTTAALYGDRLTATLEGFGARVSTAVVPCGESSKSVEQLARLWSIAVNAGLDRHSVVVALGGGVVGDLAGFLAASLYRGVGFVQVPTTLLAMVDSAVGGKTGINLPEGKNLVGAFLQPSHVVCDLAVLASLSEREFNAGMAEVIKYGCIYDSAFFAWMEENVARISARDGEALAHVVARSCEIKAEVVSQDEREGGLRAILNFGHTLGHAIEQVSGYGNWLHGEAISVGMMFAAHLSVQVNGLPEVDVERIRALLAAFSLPVTCPGLALHGALAAMAVDKKAVGSIPRFVLLEALGKAGLPMRVDRSRVEDCFALVAG